MFLKTTFVCVLATLVSFSARAETVVPENDTNSAIEEFDPSAPGAQQLLEQFDKVYEAETGLSAFPDTGFNELRAGGCYQTSCAVFVDVEKSSQTARIYLDGRLSDQWLVSTGRPGHETPNLNTHPDGRIYQRYSSTKYPGGDWKGLGNMPYAVFIRGGVAIHGTPEGNWGHLGQVASHGCIRIHPDNAEYLNQLVRQVGVRNVWITVR